MTVASFAPLKARNCSNWWLPMSQRMPPNFSRTKNQPARGGDGGGGAQLHFLVVEDFVERFRDLDVRVAARERRDFFRVGFVDPLERGAGVGEGGAHAVDVAVIEARGGEDKLAGFDDD